MNGVSLNDVQSLRLGTDRSILGKGVHLPAGTQWRRPEDFFTDRLVVIRGVQRAFPGAYELPGQKDVAARFSGTPIMPLKAELLAYLTAEHIQGAAFYEATTNGIRFGLKLPLDGGRGLTVSQEFGPTAVGNRDRKPRPITYDDHGIPVVEIWPNFTSEAWKTYFVFWDSRGGDAFYAKPYGAPESARFAEKRPSGVAEREVTQLGGCPEFLQCSTKEKQADGSSVDVETGVLMPHLDPLQQEPAAEFHIGVDFGTSNTNVYLRRDQARPVPLVLKTVTHPVTESPESDRGPSLYGILSASRPE